MFETRRGCLGPWDFAKVKWLLGLIILLPSLMLSSGVHADDIKDAKKAANAFFKKERFTAKIDLQATSEYNVNPDGKPSEGKDQGRFKKRLGIGAKDIAYPVGEGGTGIYVYVSKRKKRIKVMLLPRRGPGMRVATMFINFDRPLEATDVTPQVIARALEAYVEFTGVTVGSEIDDALEQLESGETDQVTTPVPVPTPVPATASNIGNLSVRSNPSNVSPGSKVDLEMSFEVFAATQTVYETREIKYEGQLLPGFPKTHNSSRDIGTHVSRYLQPIPVAAPTGVYYYKGEICADGDCVSRTVKFIVE